MRQLKAIIISTLVSVTGFSQDLIVKRDSSKIFCKIIKEDSLTIRYKSHKDKQGVESIINKSDVLSYRNSANIKSVRDKTKGRNGLDSLYADNLYTTAQLKTGAYKSHFEFINNLPSITDSFSVVKRETLHGPVTCDLIFNKGPHYSNRETLFLENGNLYGFCDGKAVYVQAAKGVGYCQLDYIGKYSFYTEVVHSIGVQALIPNPFIIVDEKGDQKEGTVPYIEKLLTKEYPDLCIKYKAEPDQREKRQAYMILLNEYLKNKK